MGVLVYGGLASGGSPSSARLTVGTYCWNKAHLEPTGGILSGRLAGRIPLLTSFLQVDNETATFCGFPNPTVPVPGPPGVSGVRRRIGLPYWNVTRGGRLKGTKLTLTGAGDARNDLAQALPQRLLDPVGVWNGVDWDNGLGHGHPADLDVVITLAGENRGHYLPSLVRSHEPAQ